MLVHNTQRDQHSQFLGAQGLKVEVGVKNVSHYLHNAYLGYSQLQGRNITGSNSTESQSEPIASNGGSQRSSDAFCDHLSREHSVGRTEAKTEAFLFFCLEV